MVKDRKAYYREYYATHKEEYKRYAEKHWTKVAEMQGLAGDDAWRVARKNYHRQWMSEHPEELREYRKRYWSEGDE